MPLCLLLGLCSFSKALTGLLVFLVTVALVATDALTEPAKVEETTQHRVLRPRDDAMSMLERRRAHHLPHLSHIPPQHTQKLAIIFLTWDVLIPVVQPEITLISLLVDLLAAVLGANIVCVAVMTLPVPRMALWLVRWRLEELAAVMAKFVEDSVASFCLQDDSGMGGTRTAATMNGVRGYLHTVLLLTAPKPHLHTHTPTTTELYDLEGVLDEAAALLQQARALLPDVRFELSFLFSCGRRRHGSPDRAIAYDRLARYVTVLEAQVENCRGMAVALQDIFPNATHGEFVRAMQPALWELARECRVVLEGTCNHICDGLRLGCCGDGGRGGWGREAREDGAGVSMELFMCVTLPEPTRGHCGAWCCLRSQTKLTRVRDTRTHKQAPPDGAGQGAEPVPQDPHARHLRRRAPCFPATTTGPQQQPRRADQRRC